MKGLGQHVQVGRPAMDISFYRTVGSPLSHPPQLQYKLMFSVGTDTEEYIMQDI